MTSPNIAQGRLLSLKGTARRFGAILADPPWRFRTWSETNQAKSASKHYGLMEFDDIKAMPVADVAAIDCTLFLWAIDSMLPQAVEVGSAWGFKFKTVAFVWAKEGRERGIFPIGTGYWTRANPEQCLLFTRGKPRRVSKAVRKLIVAPRREHSRKPDEVFTSIERLVDGPYLELFARADRPGWTVWGNEVGKFNAKKP
jgi:N6-adenosine-specific RNA methylase IME4